MWSVRGRRRGASLAWASSVRLRERHEGEAGIALARRPPNLLDGMGENRYLSKCKNYSKTVHC